MEKVEQTGPASEELFELVLHEDPALAATQIIFKVYPHLTTYHSNDLYRRHPDPTKSQSGRGDAWIHACRRDGFVKLAWLAKFYARDVEERILRCVSVNAVVMGGEGRERACLLVELKHDSVVEGELPRKRRDKKTRCGVLLMR